MTKKNRVFKLLGALVVMLFVCLCLLGSTFARYTSSGSGSGQVEVAKWSITEDAMSQQNNQIVSFSKLSPNMAVYSSGTTGTVSASSSGYNSSGYRYHSTAWVLVADIANAGDVVAVVTLTVGSAATLTPYDSGVTVPDNWTNKASNAAARFSIVWGYNTDQGSTYTSWSDPATPIEVAATNGHVYIYAYVVWTTDDSNSGNDGGTAADALDTDIGYYIETVTWNVAWTAVQASQLPTA